MAALSRRLTAPGSERSCGNPFAPDSPLEGEGFEPWSPVRETFFSNPLIKWQRAAHNELCHRRNDQVLDAAKFKQGDGANEAGFGGIAPKNYWK